MQREGQERGDENHRRRPPGRPAKVLDQIPYEELVEREAEQIDRHEPHAPHMVPITRAMILEAVGAVDEVADPEKHRKTTASDTIGSTPPYSAMALSRGDRDRDRPARQRIAQHLHGIARRSLSSRLRTNCTISSKEHAVRAGPDICKGWVGCSTR